MIDSLTQISDQVKRCNLCKLSKSRLNAVPGDGTISAKIMIIGEAPGKTEDTQGRPFVGMAGKILRNVLEKVDIGDETIFITNIVKCRPPNNRIPEEDERISCKNYLDRQVSLISPTIICVLGGTAYSFLLGGKSIMADHGKIIVRDNLKYFVTIHPAATIYNKQLKEIFEKDMEKLSYIIKETSNKQRVMSDFMK